MTGQQQVLTGVLFVDCGTPRRGGGWLRHPRAKYECLLCGTAEGPVEGAEAVTQFAATIRAQHHQTHHTNQQGAQAA